MSLTENQQAALISFIFNFGSGKFQASTLPQKLNRVEYLAAVDELPRWIYAKGGVKLQGLATRRQHYYFPLILYILIDSLNQS
ncbi:lysozyme [Rickettsia monacensis]|uniref:lysozyme n=1 Tax=Rickettsia monacensis TaxID=109232 RepID=UPI0005FC04E4|nr:glycoside hydrolase family protein [Rickettsia monacensis]